MTEHRHELRNVRLTPGTDALCYWCDQPLHLLADLTQIITPRPGKTFCNDAVCYTRWVLLYGGTHPLNPDPKDPVAAAAWRPPRAHVEPLQSPLRPAAPSTAVLPPSKSVARQTGEAAANVVGFLIWFIVVSAIAAAIFAVTGIDTGR